MPRPATGTYFRRADQTYGKATARKGVLYFRWENSTGATHRRSQTLCLFTTSPATARQRVAWFGGPIPLDDRPDARRHLAALGKRAERDLNERIERAAARRKPTAEHPPGTFFRRGDNGTYYPPHDPAARHAVVYFVNPLPTKDGRRRRRTISLYTRSLTTARDRVLAFNGEPLPLTSFDQFLWQIVLIGHRAAASASSA